MAGEARTMKPAPLDPLARHVLRALYELAELDVAAHAAVLGRAVGRAAADVARALWVLDARGLASAERTRLTLLGLAEAARLPALGLARERWVNEARPPARLLVAPARFDGASALSPLRRCAGEGRPELKRARRN
jgi:hypothetical protein